MDKVTDQTVLTVQLPPITEEQLIRYAGASNDFNPIHTIEKRAIQFGLPGVIAHGMLTMAFMGRLFGPKIASGSFFEKMHARFKGKVFVGDSLTVLAIKEDKGLSAQTEYYTIRVLNQSKKEVAGGYVQLKLPG